MENESAHSSNLKSVGYENGILEVEFHNGGIYQYHGVPESVFHELMNAPSRGSYFHWNVRKTGYPCAKIH
jgi:hypothetical protein